MIFVYWLIVIVCYVVAFYCLLRVFLVGVSFLRDVPYVPITTKCMENAISVLDIKDGDKVVDIGSGDGKFILYAAKRFPNVGFTGYEISSTLVFLSRLKVKVKRLKNVKFIKADALCEDFSEFNKVYLYMMSEFNEKLMPRLKNQLSEGSVVISCYYKMGSKFMELNEIKEHEFDNTKRFSKTGMKIFEWVR